MRHGPAQQTRLGIDKGRIRARSVGAQGNLGAATGRSGLHRGGNAQRQQGFLRHRRTNDHDPRGAHHPRATRGQQGTCDIGQKPVHMIRHFVAQLPAKGGRINRPPARRGAGIGGKGRHIRTTTQRRSLILNPLTRAQHPTCGGHRHRGGAGGLDARLRRGVLRNGGGLALAFALALGLVCHGNGAARHWRQGQGIVDLHRRIHRHIDGHRRLNRCLFPQTRVDQVLKIRRQRRGIRLGRRCGGLSRLLGRALPRFTRNGRGDFKQSIAPPRRQDQGLWPQTGDHLFHRGGAVFCTYDNRYHHSDLTGSLDPIGAAGCPPPNVATTSIRRLSGSSFTARTIASLPRPETNRENARRSSGDTMTKG